jgi:hypothetical protein
MLTPLLVAKIDTDHTSITYVALRVEHVISEWCIIDMLFVDGEANFKAM